MVEVVVSSNSAPPVTLEKIDKKLRWWGWCPIHIVSTVTPWDLIWGEGKGEKSGRDGERNLFSDLLDDHDAVCWDVFCLLFVWLLALSVKNKNDNNRNDNLNKYRIRNSSRTKGRSPPSDQ